MKYLLDTSVCVPLVNGSEKALRDRVLGLRPDAVAISSVVKAELYFGAYHSPRVAENMARVERFCRGLESLPFDDESARHYGGIRAQLQREGRPIGANDLLIAATALASDRTLVTRNLEEFRRVPGLRVEGW